MNSGNSLILKLLWYVHKQPNKRKEMHKQQSKQILQNPLLRMNMKATVAVFIGCYLLRISQEEDHLLSPSVRNF